ncbi:MAG: hypothetical protein KY437_03705 [Actinobacteria bacterium]|nr:hypothetical protein [Actinomycetota bacterium]
MRFRPTVRRLLIGAATGALMVSAAWAGTGLAPVDPPEEATDVVTEVTEQVDAETGDATRIGEATATAATPTSSLNAPEDPETFHEPESVPLPADAPEQGWYHVGAAKVNLYPNPDAYGGTWVQDREACATLSESFFSDVPGNADHVAAVGSPWPENPNCIYMGGYGLGPMNPIIEFDSEYGLWVRTVAIHDGTEPLFLTVIDAEGWFWDYNSKCDDCGFKQISKRLAAEFEVDPSAFIFHSTHSHTAMDFIGGWGFVPDWYMQQATDSIEESIRRSVDAMELARLEVGEVTARDLNHERRNNYHAPEEQQLGWLRAYVPGETTTTTDGEGESGGKGDGDGANGTTTTTTTPSRTIATIGTYAAHPTTLGTNDGVGHGDWPVLFERRVEERFGGVGLHFMTGLGNMSAANPGHVHDREDESSTDMGRHLGDLVPAVGSGTPISTTDVRTTQAKWDQPTTNVPLSSLGAAGFFDRQFNQTPAHVNTGDSERSPCVSASPVSVEVVANVARIGQELFVTSGPGELFSNTTNTIKEKASEDHGGAFALPIAQANDALGYLPETFEQAENKASGQGAGFGPSGTAYIEYEDAYSIDRCFGDMTLETTLKLMGSLP